MTYKTVKPVIQPIIFLMLVQTVPVVISWILNKLKTPITKLVGLVMNVHYVTRLILDGNLQNFWIMTINTFPSTVAATRVNGVNASIVTQIQIIIPYSPVSVVIRILKLMIITKIYLDTYIKTMLAWLVIRLGKKKTSLIMTPLVSLLQDHM